MEDKKEIRPVEWRDDALYLIDQRELPDMLSWVRIEKLKDLLTAIKTMQVRGAPAIGCAAAFGFYLAARESRRTEGVRELRQARPTAVNLNWALDRMQDAHDMERDLLTEAQSILDEDIAANQAMGVFGAGLVEGPVPVLTHCNAGALATGGYGTALGVVRAGWEEGRITEVFATETRPRLQGTKLTAWELAYDGIPSTVLTDSAAASLLSEGKVKWLIVGADRIAENGDVANKIGTLSLAVIANHFDIPMMVVAPLSTIDWDSKTGGDIPIESRSEKEVWKGKRSELVSFKNQAFDITPADLIDWIVTERGTFKPSNLGDMFSGTEERPRSKRSRRHRGTIVPGVAPIR